MGIKHRLSGAHGRKDEGPNIELAVDIVAAGDVEALEELAQMLGAGFPTKQRHDALKTLCEVGTRQPGLLVPHLETLVGQLRSPNNRCMWSAMVGLSALVEVAPQPLLRHLALIMDTAKRSSVIAKDKAMVILAGLAVHRRFRGQVVPLLFEHLIDAPMNQFPSYAEAAESVLEGEDREALVKLIGKREDYPELSAKRRRIEKLLKRLGAS